jgi:predicted Fe-S protein YdhL (DUF1289 family)
MTTSANSGGIGDVASEHNSRTNGLSRRHILIYGFETDVAATTFTLGAVRLFQEERAWARTSALTRAEVMVRATNRLSRRQCPDLWVCNRDVADLTSRFCCFPT